MAKISAQFKDGSAGVDFDYDFGDSLEETIEKFGESVVHKFAIRGFTIAAQGTARGLMKSGKSHAEIVEHMKTWKPDEPRQVKSKEERVKELLGKMTPEQREALAAELRSERGNAGAEPGAAPAGKKTKAG